MDIGLKGQISIEYLGGAALFFLALLFVVVSALNTLPQFSEGIETNSLEITAWTASSTLISTTGYWEDGSRQGTDWHNHLSATEENGSIGLATEEGDLHRGKILALLELPYSTMKRLLKTEKEFMISFAEFATVDTSKMFVKGNPPDKFEDEFNSPSTSRYGNADSNVHYGAIRIENDEKYFLVTSHNDTYETVYVSDSWDFGGSPAITPTDSTMLEFGRREYELRPITAGISTSRGNVVTLERELGVIGRRPAGAVSDIVNVQRFSNIDEHPVRIDFEVWEG